MSSNGLTVKTLERWVSFGAHWRIVQLSGRQSVIDLCNCAGALLERLQSDDPV